METYNILVLQGEDVGRHLGCYGDSYAQTPNLDQLAAEGMRFTNAFSHAPVCAPSRGGMMIGCYPWTKGNHHMRSTLSHPPRCYTHELRDAGRYVAWPSKLDFNFEPTEGWCDTQEPWHTQNAPKQPFFLYENFSHSHESAMFGDLRPNWHHPLPPEAEGLAPHDPDQAQVPPHLIDCPESRKQVADYYDNFSVIDAQIGARLKWLDDQGLRDNTIVIFLSDHGRGLPREKRWCYDAGIHLPLIVRWPGTLEPGSVCDDLVAWVDVAPTLLALAGAPIPEHYQGQVFLGPDAAPPRECVFAGRDRMDEVFDYVRCVRDKQWHYIRNFAPELPWAQNQKYMEQQPIMPIMRKAWAEGRLEGANQLFFEDEKPIEELYDVEKDPDMIHNLAADPALAPVLEQMRTRLQGLTEEFGDLAQTSEEELVAQGLVEDRIEEYKERFEALPEEWQLGPQPLPTTLREFEASKAD